LAEKRLTSLDAFRGMTIAGMILVNNPGSWESVYPLLRHADWHGWTPTDLVFPFFLYIVGISISLSLTVRKTHGFSDCQCAIKIARRTLILFGLGLLLNLIPAFDFGAVRIPGVLQRIAVCYLAAALLFLKTSIKTRLLMALGILISYWLILTYVPVPSLGAGILTQEGNLCAYIDTRLLGGHLYKPGFDPEGILSTFPAIATTLLGTLCGDWLRVSPNRAVAAAGLLASGIVLFISGHVLAPFFPVNKQLWTSTYVLLTAGAASIVMGVCCTFLDGYKLKRWALPFLVFGGNAITVYVGSSLLAKMMGAITIRVDINTLSLKDFLFECFFSPLSGDYFGSLLFPIILLLFWFLILLPMHRKNIHVKI